MIGGSLSLRSWAHGGVLALGWPCPPPILPSSCRGQGAHGMPVAPTATSVSALCGTLRRRVSTLITAHGSVPMATGQHTPECQSHYTDEEAEAQG